MKNYYRNPQKLVIAKSENLSDSIRRRKGASVEDRSLNTSNQDNELISFSGNFAQSCSLTNNCSNTVQIGEKSCGNGTNNQEASSSNLGDLDFNDPNRKYSIGGWRMFDPHDIGLVHLCPSTSDEKLQYDLWFLDHELDCIDGVVVCRKRDMSSQCELYKKFLSCSNAEQVEKDWHVVVNKKAKSRVFREYPKPPIVLPHVCVDPDIELHYELMERVKVPNHSGKRWNIKETRHRYGSKKRKEVKNGKYSKLSGIDWKNIEPHGGEDYYDWELHEAAMAAEDSKFFAGLDKKHPVRDELVSESVEPRVIYKNKIDKIWENAPSLKENVDPKFSLTSLLSDLPKSFFECDDAQMRLWMHYSENVVLLAYHLSNAQSYMDVCVAIISYIKSHTADSIFYTIKELIFDIIDTEKNNVEPHGFDSKTLLSSWEALKGSSIFKSINYLICAAMTLPICSIKQIEWNPAGFALMKAEAFKGQLKATDLIDALLNTFVWVADVGYKIISTGSLDALLYTDVNMKKYNDLCDDVIAHGPTCIAGNGDIQDYEVKLDEAIKCTLQFKRTKNDVPTTQWLQTRYVKLLDLKEKVIAKHRNTGMRMAPLGWAIVGTTGAGKTSVAKLFMKCSLDAMGYDSDPSKIITKDPFDKFDSTYTSDLNGLYMDDVGNSKPDFVDVSPTDIIIKFFNNVNAQAVKADLAEKGTIFINFKCGVLTSNIEDLGARHYSECPESILRRFYHVRVSVKPEFRKPGSLCLDPSHETLKSGNLAVDVWNLDILECRPYERGSGTSYTFEPMKVQLSDDEFVLTKNMDIKTCLRVVVVLAQKHRAEQQNVLELAHNADKFPSCKCCFLPSNLCSCPKQVIPDSLDMFFDPIERVAVNSIKKGFKSFLDRQFWWISPTKLVTRFFGINPIEKMLTKSIADEITRCVQYNTLPVMSLFLPDSILKSSFVQTCITSWSKSSAMYDLTHHFKYGNYFLGIVWLGFGFTARREHPRDVLLSGSCLLSGTIAFNTLSYTYYCSRTKHYIREYEKRRDAFTPIARKKCQNAAKGAIIVLAIYLSLKAFREWKNKQPKPQSRDIDSHSWNDWFTDKMGMVFSKRNSTTSPNDIVISLEKSNLYHANFERLSCKWNDTQCNIFFPRKSVAMYPAHVWYQNADMSTPIAESLCVTVNRSSKPGGVFQFVADSSNTVFYKKGDMCLTYVPNCPDLRDKSKWFADQIPIGTSLGEFISVDYDEHFNLSFERERISIKVDTGYSKHNFKSFPGGYYNTNRAKRGACMSPIVSDTKNPVIVGFHIGGQPSTTLGVFHAMTQDIYNEMLSDLQSLPGVLLSSNGGCIPIETYGRPTIVKADVYPHSMAAGLRRESYVELFGSTRLRTVQRSTVMKSIISDSVTDVCGVPLLWGPPKLMPNWQCFNASLEHMVRPPRQFSPSLVEAARTDWLKPLLLLASTQKLRPLTFKESILGVPGKRFLESLNMSTGMGFPVFGPKRRHFDEVWVDGVLEDRRPSPEIITECDRLMTCWLRNERGYPISTATLKDEPTKIGSEKVRVFQAAPVAFSIHVRKYFLPIVRFLSMFPIETECAVGLNSFSPDWEELIDYAKKFDSGHGMLAWDYSKYDIRMSSQITRAVLLSYIDIAEIGGYDVCDLNVMRAMISDIVHPLIDYNGTLLMCFNMNTSGNNITVNINSTAGSLYVRLGLYHALGRVVDFRKYVSCMTYGDDFIGSIDKSMKETFNFRVYKKFLEEHDMKITPPNKSEEEFDFLPFEDVDFLKRKSQYIPEIGHSIGKLDEMSIFKSLHANLKSKTQTQREVSASCIEGALHEWFAHGRDVYEKRRLEMIKICETHKLLIPALDLTFSQRVELWKEKYD